MHTYLHADTHTHTPLPGKVHCHAQPRCAFVKPRWVFIEPRLSHNQLWCEVGPGQALMYECLEWPCNMSKAVKYFLGMWQVSAELAHPPELLRWWRRTLSIFFYLRWILRWGCKFWLLIRLFLFWNLEKNIHIYLLGWFLAWAIPFAIGAGPHHSPIWSPLVICSWNFFRHVADRVKQFPHWRRMITHRHESNVRFVFWRWLLLTSSPTQSIPRWTLSSPSSIASQNQRQNQSHDRNLTINIHTINSQHHHHSSSKPTFASIFATELLR